MILLGLSLFLRYNLLQCVEFEKLDINVLLKAHNENSSLGDSTPAVYQLDPITPEYAFFTPPNVFPEEIPHESSRSQNIHDTQHKISKIYFRQRSRPKKPHGFTVIDIYKKSEERRDSQKQSSSNSFREDDTSEGSSSESGPKEFKNRVNYNSVNSYPRPKEKASDSQSSREPGLLRSRQPQALLPAMLRTTPTEKTTRHKRRLKPNILLPVTIINVRNADANVDIFKKKKPPKTKHKWNFGGNKALKKKPRKDKHKRIFGDDKDIFKMMRPRKDIVERVLRMHVISETTKKMWYSDRMKEESKTQTKSLTHDRNAENDAKTLKKPPKSKDKWNFGGNKVLKKKKPRKNKHEGIFGDDKNIFKMMRPRKDKHKNVLRMQAMSTKKIWYSDRMKGDSEIQTKQMKTLRPAPTSQLLRQMISIIDSLKNRLADGSSSALHATKKTTSNDWSHYDESNQEQDKQQDTTVSTKTTNKYESSIEYLRAPLSKNDFFKMMERRQEGYMIVFLTALTQIIATKEKEAVHDVVKHADSIIHRQSKKLLWMTHPLLDVTQKLATMLKVTDITSIQAQAASIYHMLLKRHETLPVVVNTILEYAETMYDDDEGLVLFDTLKELVTFPKIALSGYWLCNSLINAFLRPFRRLKDTLQLQELLASVNLALKTQDPLRSHQKQPLRGEGFGAHADGPAVQKQLSPQKESFMQIGPQITTPRPLRKRKRKRHHRLHKRKRDKKHLLLRDRPRSTHGDKRLTSTSVTPSTTVYFWFRDTTIPT